VGRSRRHNDGRDRGRLRRERCQAVLKGLAERGLIRPPLSAGERDELAEKDAEIARLKVQLTEFAGVAA
jgi:hypothetical protein